MLPTVGTWANFHGAEQLALGEWQDQKWVREMNLSGMCSAIRGTRTTFPSREAEVLPGPHGHPRGRP